MTSRSPWRYPGGKARIADAILSHLTPWDDYVEPFVGGGGFTLPALDRTPPGALVQLNDADDRVAAWWEVLALGSDSDFDRLCTMLLDYQPTVKSFLHHQRRGRKSARAVDKAFSAFVTNRCSFSGALDAGPIGGINQSSAYTVNCRYNAERLVNLHVQVRQQLQQFDVRIEHKDFRDFLADASRTALWYLDPPYVRKSSELYSTYFDIHDHEALVEIVQTTTPAPQWAISYDDVPWVRERYAGSQIIEIPIRYSVKSSTARSTELLILGLQQSSRTGSVKLKPPGLYRRSHCVRRFLRQMTQ